MALKDRLRSVQLFPVTSTAVRRLGFDTGSRMAVVQFAEGPTIYGYPNLTDDEVRGWLDVMQNHGSIGHFISTVIKPNHDHERVSYSP